MDNDRIRDSRNRVFINNLAIGKNIPIAMSTSANSIYRVTGLDQIEDIINCGYVRPKNGKVRGGHTNEIFWTKGGEKTFYYDKRPVLEVPENKLKNGQIGSISIEELSGIWIFDESKNRYINKIDYFKDLYKQRHLNNTDYIPLKSLYFILNENGYVCLGHGTGRSGNANDIIQSIFQNGLRTKDNSLYYTTIGLDTTNIEALQQKLNEWQHQDSKKIILIRLPIAYINMLGDSADLDGEKFGAFYNEKISSDGKITYYLDPKFIIGCYDIQKQAVILNSNFERLLSEDTLRVLNEKYKRTLEKRQARFKRLKEALDNMGESAPNEVEKLGNLEWDLSDFDNIAWGQVQDEIPKKDNCIKNCITRKN